MISVVYAVYNEEAILEKSLASVHDWADEIVVVDGDSTDETVKIARKYGAKILKTTNKLNFHINKQLAIDNAQGDLILQLDADEVVDGRLRDFIVNLDQHHSDKYVAWKLKRKNLFAGKFLTKGGQYPDMVIRLFYRGQAYLPQKDVHEQMVVKGKVGVAPGHLLHFANPDLSSYWRKFNTYTSFTANQLAQKKVKINAGNYFKYFIWKPSATFWNIWLRHRGYVDGLAGFLFAWWSGWHHAVAYAKYIESTRVVPDGKIRVYYPGNKTEAKAGRGVGRYMNWLIEAVQQVNEVIVVNKRSQANIVHYLFFDLYRNTLKKVNKKQKLIVTVHDLIPRLFPQDYPVGWRGRFNFWRQKRRLRQADMVVVDSQATKNDVMKLCGVATEKVKVVYLAANPALAPADKSEINQLRKNYLLPEKYLLYVGDINFNKNLAQLIKALKFLPEEIQLVMVGKNFVPQEIPEWLTLQEQMNMSEVNSRVKFLTNVTAERELAALYSGALAYVQPSYYEGFGLPVLEAMACRTVVICHRNSSLAEVANQSAIYTSGLKAQDFADAVMKVVQMTPSEREKLLHQAEEWQRQFTWEQTAREVIGVYEKVAEYD
ncbi:glycosyltransferase [bacterium]|nr:glycosyltransferase [bacterium]